MSYDLMVFRKEAAPTTRKEFMEWFDAQAEWEEDHDYMDPKVTSPELSNWFMEMIETFPALNGPHATEDYENPNVTDYSIGKDVIYAGFGWPVAVESYQKMTELAAKHGVGFFDASGNEGHIYFPENGKLVRIGKSSGEGENKPWWKFW